MAEAYELTAVTSVRIVRMTVESVEPKGKGPELCTNWLGTPRKPRPGRGMERNLSLPVFRPEETAKWERLLLLAGSLFGGGGLFFLLIGTTGLDLFL